MSSFNDSLNVEKNKPRRGLLGSSFVVSTLTFLSRILGLLRDIVFALVIGASPLADAFFVAFKIPNFLRRLFAEGAFSQAFVPVLSEYRERNDRAAVKMLIDRVAGSLGSVLILITLLAVLASPMLAALFAPGWFWADAEKFAATSQMIKITFPYLMLISLTGLAGGILNCYDRFAVPAFTPVLLNLSLIAAALVAAPWFEQPVYALAWGVMIAGIVQLIFQLPFLSALHLLPRPVLDWKHEGVQRILRLMVPALFGVSVSQINLMLDTIIASFLPSGSVSWLYYSDRLAELPLGVFAVAIATVILPSLSRKYSAESAQKFSATLDWALRLVLLIAVPAALALAILAKPILITLFYHGTMITMLDIDMASMSLIAYAMGVAAFMLIKVLAPGYYARQDIKTPVRIGVVALVSNMLFNVIFALALHHYYGVGHVGLALATTLSAYINAGLLFRGLYRRKVYLPAPGWGRFLAQLVVASGLMVGSLLWLLQFIPDWAIWVWWQRAINMVGVCSLGRGVYVVVLYICGLRARQFHHN